MFPPPPPLHFCFLSTFIYISIITQTTHIIPIIDTCPIWNRITKMNIKIKIASKINRTKFHAGRPLTQMMTTYSQVSFGYYTHNQTTHHKNQKQNKFKKKIDFFVCLFHLIFFFFSFVSNLKPSWQCLFFISFYVCFTSINISMCVGIWLLQWSKASKTNKIINKMITNKSVCPVSPVECVAWYKIVHHYPSHIHTYDQET